MQLLPRSLKRLGFLNKPLAQQVAKEHRHDNIAFKGVVVIAEEVFELSFEAAQAAAVHAHADMVRRRRAEIFHIRDVKNLPNDVHGAVTCYPLIDGRN